MKKQKILITGGAGYIGGTVARLMLAQGHEVTIVDNFCHSKREALPEGAAFVETDIADTAVMMRVMSETKFDGVLHFAALIEAGESMKAPGVYFEANTVKTLALLRAVVATGTPRLVFSSTAAVYGEPEETPILEKAKLAPTNVYGESKLMAERMLAWFSGIHGLKYAVLRYFNVAGANEGYGENHEPESHLIPIILDVAMGRRESIAIYGTDYPTADGTCIRDYIHVGDLARAHVMALDALGESYKHPLLFNLGNGQGFTVRQVIEAARRVTGHAIPVVEHPRRAGDPAVLVASSAKAQRELGWVPEHPELDEILASAWAWHQKLHGGVARG